MVLELEAAECRDLALQLITCEGFCQMRERQYRDWAVQARDEAGRAYFTRQAEEAREEYLRALGLRDKLYRAEARAQAAAQPGNEHQ